ncbi:hypothetical protein SNE40_000132 [Patella caerulea]
MKEEGSPELDTDIKSRSGMRQIFFGFVNCFYRFGNFVRRILRGGSGPEIYQVYDVDTSSTISGATTVSGFTISALDDSYVNFNLKSDEGLDAPSSEEEIKKDSCVGEKTEIVTMPPPNPASTETNISTPLSTDSQRNLNVDPVEELISKQNQIDGHHATTEENETTETVKEQTELEKAQTEVVLTHGNKINFNVNVQNFHQVQKPSSPHVASTYEKQPPNTSWSEPILKRMTKAESASYNESIFGDGTIKTKDFTNIGPVEGQQNRKKTYTKRKKRSARYFKDGVKRKRFGLSKSENMEMSKTVDLGLIINYPPSKSEGTADSKITETVKLDSSNDVGLSEPPCIVKTPESNLKSLTSPPKEALLNSNSVNSQAPKSDNERDPSSNPVSENSRPNLDNPSSNPVSDNSRPNLDKSKVKAHHKSSLLKSCFSVEDDSDDENAYTKSEIKDKTGDIDNNRDEGVQSKILTMTPTKKVDYSIFTTDYTMDTRKGGDSKIKPSNPDIPKIKDNSKTGPLKGEGDQDKPIKGKGDQDNSIKATDSTDTQIKGSGSPDIPMKTKIELLIDRDNRHLLNLKQSNAKLSTRPNSKLPVRKSTPHPAFPDLPNLPIDLSTVLRQGEIIIRLRSTEAFRSTQLIIKKPILVRLVNHYLMHTGDRWIGDSLERQFATYLKENEYFKNDIERRVVVRALRLSLTDTSNTGRSSQSKKIYVYRNRKTDLSESPVRRGDTEPSRKSFEQTEYRNMARTERARSLSNSHSESENDEESPREVPSSFADKSTDTGVEEPTMYCITPSGKSTRYFPKDPSRYVRKNEKCIQVNSSLDLHESLPDGSEYSIAFQQENFDIGTYRMDDHVVAEKAKKGCRPEEKLKIKTRGIPNKHLDTSFDHSFNEDSFLDDNGGEEEATEFGEPVEDEAKGEGEKKDNVIYDHGPVILDARHMEALPYKVLHEKKRNPDTTPPSSGKNRKKKNHRKMDKGTKGQDPKAKMNLQTFFNFKDERGSHHKSKG